MTNYVASIMHLVPNANISYAGVDVAYEDINWLDERTQPTKEECDAIWQTVNYNQQYETIRRARQERYTNETDGLFFDAQREGLPLDEWIAAVNAIKAELPYPEAPAA